MNFTIDVYAALIELLKDAKAPFRIMNHEPAGQTEHASRVRGHALSQAAKAMVLMLELKDRTRRFVLAVIPGNRRVHFASVAQAFGGRDARLASAEQAAAMTNCEMGSIPPFSFHSELQLIVDDTLLQETVIVFNAGRLDRSVFLATEDYRRITRPLRASISRAAGSLSEVAGHCNR